MKKFWNDWFSTYSPEPEMIDVRNMHNEPGFDPLAEKRKAAIEWLGERWILHPKNNLAKQKVKENVLTR